MACEEGWCDDDGRYFLSRGCQGSKDAREPISTCELEGVQNLHVPSDESAAKSAAESTGSQNSAGAVLQIRACEADSQEQRRHSSSGSDVDPMELLPVLLMPQIQPSHTSLERNEDSGLGSDTQDPAAVPVEWIGEAGSTITSDDGEPQRRSLQRQLQPRTREDFAYLHEQVRLWMERETAAVKAKDLSKVERTAAFLRICVKETRYLQTIDARQQVVLKENKPQAALRQLEVAAEAAVWPLSSGKISWSCYLARNLLGLDQHCMHELCAEACHWGDGGAQEVASVYAQLSGGTASSADRMDTLLHARLMLSQYGHSMFGPLELVDREIDMLKRGRSTASLLPLRLRLIDALRIAHASSQSSHKSVK